MLENIASDEANLEAKIDKKKQELERNQKRLRSLESVRYACKEKYKEIIYDTKISSQYDMLLYVFLEKRL